MITGDPRRDPAAALATGFDRHVVKPTNLEVIRGLIAQADTALAG